MSADDTAGYGPDVSPFKPRERRPLMARTFPVSTQLAGYPKDSARRDVVAGITVAALALPSGMAYAEVAGLSPVAGLYALLLPVAAYAILGSSRLLMVGPTGAVALLVATSIAPLAGRDAATYAALAAMLAVLVAALSLAARLIRLGWVADYISRAVLVGYLHGIAVVLVCGQLGKLYGVPVKANDPLGQVREFVQGIGQAHGLTIVVGFAALAALLLLRIKAPRVPAALVVVVGGIAISALFSLSSHGVAVVGDIPSGLPSFRWPGAGLRDTLELLPTALGVFAVGYADLIVTARSFAGRNGQHVDANQELLAFAALNLTAGITQGFPVGASESRTAVNEQMGGRTQVVGLVAAGVAALVLLFLTGPVANLPKACLAAVIVAAAIGLVDPDAWRGLALAGRSQVLIAAATLAGVVVYGVLEALIVAVALSILEVVMRSARPHDAVLGYVPRLDRWANVSTHLSARVTPGVVVYRLDDRLFFANARYVKGRIREAVAGAPSTTRFLVFDAEGLVGIDASGVEAMERIHLSLLRSGITLVLARLKSHVFAAFETTGLVERIGREHVFPTVHAAVSWCSEQPDEAGEAAATG